MRFACSIACVIVALDCFGKGSGDIEQTLIADDYLWTWNMLGLIWSVGATIVFVQGAE